MSERQPWDAFWMEMATLVATRSKCDRRQIGAVITESDERAIVGIGYNGAPSGFPEEYGETCVDFCARAQGSAEAGVSYAGCPSVHAEMNAMISAPKAAYRGGTLYVNSACCWDCSKVVANSGLRRVVMVVSDDDAHRAPRESIDMLTTCGVLVDVWAPKPGWVQEMRRGYEAARDFFG